MSLNVVCILVVYAYYRSCVGLHSRVFIILLQLFLSAESLVEGTKATENGEFI